MCEHMYVCVTGDVSSICKFVLGKPWKKGVSKTCCMSEQQRNHGVPQASCCGRGRGWGRKVQRVEFSLGSLSNEQVNKSGRQAGLGWYGSSQRSGAEGALGREHQHHLPSACGHSGGGEVVSLVSVVQTWSLTIRWGQ